ncbi:MAG: fibronectin type III domain-containing protein [Bacteroidota bacterium]
MNVQPIINHGLFRQPISLILTSMVFAVFVGSVRPAEVHIQTMGFAGATEVLTTDSIYLTARPHGDSVVLRWAPSSYIAWRKMQARGVVVQRRIAGRGDFAPLHQERIRHYELAEFESFSDTDNPHVVAVAEALHGEAEISTNAEEGPMGQAKDRLTEQDQRYFLAVLNADLSVEAATALGWRLVDRNVQAGMIYEYRVILAPTEEVEAEELNCDPIRVRSSDPYPFGPVYGLEIDEGDHQLRLRWPTGINSSRYIAYYLEISDDGTNFSREPQWPLVKVAESDYFFHELRLDENYQARYYRLRGINSFAEVSEPTEPISAQGVDKRAPSPVQAVSATDREDGSWLIEWTPAMEATPDLDGYVVTRGRSYTSEFEPIHERLIPAGTTRFVDETPLPYTPNYYQVHSVDTSGNISPGPIGLGYWNDTDPPAAPTGLSGKIDSLGNVFLIWEPGEEPDLHGYRVYVSHARDREFLQVSHDIVRQNYFFDSTRLEVLNETVYYRLVALDNNFNPSAYGEIVALQRPDKVPPTAAVFTDYSARGSQIALSWRPSSSPDLTEQSLWRQAGDSEWERVAEMGSSINSTVDSTTTPRTAYTYRIRSTDDAGLFVDSRPIQIRSGQASSRSEVISVWTCLPAAGRQASAADPPCSNDGDMPMLHWSIPTQASETIVYYAQGERGMTPMRRLAAPQSSWTMLANQSPDDKWAVQVVYQDGSRSGIFELR